MMDWYFADMFDATFWSQVGKLRITGKSAAEVLRQIVAEAGETDLTWLPYVGRLDALCRSEIAFEIRRRGDRIVWVMNPFCDQPEASGTTNSIGDAVDALTAAA
jgi:hypothetical protein